MPTNGCQKMDAKKWMPTNGCGDVEKMTFEKVVGEPWDLAS